MLPIAPPACSPLRSSFRQTAFSALGILLVFAAALPGIAEQTPSVTPNRITRAIDDSALVTLKGNVHPLANAHNDLGAAPDSQPMSHVKLVLQRSPAQEAALETYLASAQVKGSPNYHKWLTPKQFGALYGPSDTDVQKLTGWLEGEGFTVNSVANGRTTIDFSGSVAQVQNAFHISIHNYRANGVNFYANTKDPQIPSAIAPVVSGVAHLNDVPVKPTFVRGAPARYDSENHRFTPITGTSNPNPQYTVGSSSIGYSLFVVPGDAATIYDTPNSTLNANFGGGTSYTGSGVTIGIMGQSSIDPTLVQNYRTLFVGDSNAPVITNLDGVGDVPGDDQESYLDNEIAGGLAPGATIHFYTAMSVDGGVIAAAEYAIDTDDTIDILSLSYGSCELGNTNAGNQEINNDWQQAAMQGITVVVSTGDTGSVSCDAGDPQGTESATGPLSVNGFASTPYNIAVGGTDFDALYPPPNGNNFSKYVSTSSGSASTFYRTALGYIPEATWNNSPYPNTSVSQNVPLSVTTGNPSDDNIAAGSGGPSNCSTNTTTDSATGICTAGYAKPTWQTGTGVPNDQVRDIPDVSLLAGNNLYGALWTVCDGSTTGIDSTGTIQGTADCVATSGSFFVDGVGGTSAATPAFAGILALVVQKTGQRQGQAAPILYSLFNSTPSIFHDITTGNNSVGCTQTSTTTASCVKNSQGYFFESGYNTFPGYDLATGLGSVDATLLVNDWTSASDSLNVANVAATPSATSIITAEPLTITVNVAALATGGATPTGTVTAATSDGTYTSPAATLSGGSATITIPANSLTANPANIFTIAYTPASGSGFANASTFVAVAISVGTPSFAITGNSIAVAPGNSASSTITVTPAGGFTGTINLTCAVSSATGATPLPTCSFTSSSVVISSSAAGTTTLNFATTSATPLGPYTVTINGAATTGTVTASGTIIATVTNNPNLITPTVTVAPSSTSIAANQAFTVTTTVAGGSGNPTPTGTVVLTSGSYTSSPQALSSGSAVISVPASTFSAGTVTLTATYTPDTASSTVYNPANGSAQLTVTAPTGGTFTMSAASVTISSPGASGSSTITVTPGSSGFFGTVTLSCTLASAPSGANTTYNPACGLSSTSLTFNGSTAQTATASITTTAPTSGALAYPKTNQRPKNRWYTEAGGAALACILFFGIPARRRGWKSMLSLLVFLVAMAGVGCGGGGGNNNNNSTGTTTGTYTFTVTGTTGTSNSATTVTTNLSVTVN